MHLASEIVPSTTHVPGRCKSLQMSSAHKRPSIKASRFLSSWHQQARGFLLRSRRAQRHGLTCNAGYPFHRDDYHKVILQVTAGTDERYGLVGNLIFVQESEAQLSPDKSLMVTEELTENGEALVMSVTGDSLHCLLGFLGGSSNMNRPMGLDLLWQVLERGQQLSKRDWKVLHVAVVDLRNQAYIGRVFFGDAETGRIVWDCDCRPSDGCWLALKAGAPLYIKKRVWEECATSWRDLIAGAGGDVSDKRASKSNDSITTVRASDPEPVKRLKREMALAIAEEDYTTAARIRDHPFMMLQRRIWEHEQAGRKQAAETLQKQLEDLINDWAANRPD